MRRRPPPLPAEGELPAELAGGPFTDHWRTSDGHADAHKAWCQAGRAWSEAHAEHPNAWIELLDPDIARWAGALGRCRGRSLDGDLG